MFKIQEKIILNHNTTLNMLGFINQQLFTEHSLCMRHCVKHWGYQDKQQQQKHITSAFPSLYLSLK